MKYWINTVSLDHVKRGEAGGFTQANHGSPYNLKRMNLGDWLVFYSPKTSFENGKPLQCFTAIGYITDEKPYQAEMTPDFHPWRRNVTFMKCYEAPNTLELSAIDEWARTRLFFEEKGYEIKPSKVTQYSSSIIDLLGEIKNLKILNNKLIVELLDILAVKSSKKLQQKIMGKIGNIYEESLLRIFDDFNLAPELASIPKSFTELKGLPKMSTFKSDVFNGLKELSEKQMIKRGFYINCDNCGVKDWYSIGNADEYVICSGCGNKFILPIESEWKYRLNSLINRAVDQDVLAPLIAVGHLIKQKNAHCHYFGVDLFRLNDIKKITDIDFCFIENQKVIAGECKTNDGFSKKDFDNALLLANIGINEFYFCTLSNEFSKNSLTIINDLKNELIKKNLSMIVSMLTANEMLSKT